MTDDEETKDALVVVQDDQLSLAIGREGQNVRLAHRLTGWKIDIKSVSQMENEEASKISNYDYEQEEQEERVVDSEEIQEEIEEEMNQQAYDEEDLAQEDSESNEDYSEEV